MTTESSNIQIVFDEEAGCYCIIWQPMAVIGLGRTEKEALDDLREAAHSGIDTLVDIKQQQLGLN